MQSADSARTQVVMAAKWNYPEDEQDRHPVEMTDVHHKSDDGKGMFNWRMIHPVTLPCKFHFISLTIQDVFFIPGFTPDCIAENIFNMKSFFGKAHKDPKNVALALLSFPDNTSPAPLPVPIHLTTASAPGAASSTSDVVDSCKLHGPSVTPAQGRQGNVGGHNMAERTTARHSTAQHILWAGGCSGAS